jgi:hypothetical protein
MCLTSTHVIEYGAFLTQPIVFPDAAREDCETLINLACSRGRC